MDEGVEIGRRIDVNECQKVYIQRDYSLGCIVTFDNTFPLELENKIDSQTWTSFIDDLNQIYSNAVTVSGKSITECMLDFFTCYLSRLCTTSLWDKSLKEAEEFISQMNNHTFVQHNLYVSNPMEKGLRVMEVALLDEPAPKPQPKPPASLNGTLPPLQPR